MQLPIVKPAPIVKTHADSFRHFGLEDWALKVSCTVGADWKHWTKNPQKLEAARVKLGNKIEQLSRKISLKPIGKS